MAMMRGEQMMMTKTAKKTKVFYFATKPIFIKIIWNFSNALSMLGDVFILENDTVPVLRSASLALTDAAEELNRMRTDTNRDRNLLSRTLIAACADNDVNTVRRLLGDGTNTINEGTDDGESLLSLACSAGYYELAQVS